MGPLLLYVVYLVGFLLLVMIYIRMSQYIEIRQILGCIPGPKSYPFIGLFREIRKVSVEDQFKWFNDLCFSFKNGMVVTWLGCKPTVNIRKPQQLEVILGCSTFITKINSNRMLTQWLGNSVFTSTDGKWFKHRQFVKPAYCSDVLDYIIVMTKKLSILKECISKEIKSNPNSAINIFNLIYKYSFDVIYEVALGINVDSQRNRNNEYVKAFERCYRSLSFSYSQFFFKWDFFFYKTKIGKKFVTSVKIMHRFLETVIIQKQVARKQNEHLLIADNNAFDLNRFNKSSFLDRLLNMYESATSPLTLQEIREELDTFIFSGHATLSSAISWAFFIIGNNEDIQKKIQQELYEILPIKDEVITIAQLEKLQYLERVIKEVMRLFPSIPSLDRILDNNVVIDNCFIPMGTTIRLHIYQLHHDPETWDDPETFNPDRFLPENNFGRHPYAYMPFSLGPRSCIGENIAFLEIKIVLATILKKWYISSVQKPSQMKIISNFNLNPLNENIEVYLTPNNKLRPS